MFLEHDGPDHRETSNANLRGLKGLYSFYSSGLFWGKSERDNVAGLFQVWEMLRLAWT